MPITSSAITLAAVVAGAGTAAAIDLYTRRIPNAVTLSTAAIGLVLAMSGASGIAVGSSVVGFFVGMLLMLPGHILGALGAGDVKLFAALGAVLGPARIAVAFLFTAIAGGVLAMVIASYRGRFGLTVRGAIGLVRSPQAVKLAIESPAANNRFPYGPAIAAGTVVAALMGR